MLKRKSRRILAVLLAAVLIMSHLVLPVKADPPETSCPEIEEGVDENGAELQEESPEAGLSDDELPPAGVSAPEDSADVNSEKVDSEEENSEEENPEQKKSAEEVSEEEITDPEILPEPDAPEAESPEDDRDAALNEEATLKESADDPDEYEDEPGGYDLRFEDHDHRIFSDGDKLLRLDLSAFSGKTYEIGIFDVAIFDGDPEIDGEIIHLEEGTHFTKSMSGDTLEILLKGAALYEEIKNRGTNWVHVHVDIDEERDGQMEWAASADTDVEVREALEQYDDREYDRDMLPGWDASIHNRYGAYIENTENPFGNHFDYFVKDVRLISQDPENAVIEDFHYDCDENDPENYWWYYRAKGHGTAVFEVKYEKYDGSTDTYTFNVNVSDEVYSVNIEPDEGVQRTLPGGTIGLTAVPRHHSENEEQDGNISGITYEWSLEEGDDEFASIESDGGRAFVHFRELREDEYGIWQDIGVLVKIYDGTDESGQPVFRASEIFILTVADRYFDLRPAKIDSYPMVGEQIKVTAQLRSYSLEDAPNYSVMEKVHFCWHYDPNCVEIRDSEGNIVGNENESGEYIDSPASTGKDCEFTILRKGDWWTNIDLASYYSWEEDGEIRENEEHRNFILEDVRMDFWFEDMNEGDHARVFADGTTEFRINTDRLDEFGRPYTLVLEAGRGWKGDGELDHIIEGDYFTVDGNRVIFDGKKMTAVKEIADMGYVDFIVKAFAGDFEIARRSSHVRIEWPDINYDFQIAEEEEILPYWDHGGDGIVRLWIRNAEFEDGMNYDLPVTDAFVVNENEDDPAVLFESYKEDGRVRWYFRATESFGNADLHLKYTDYDGSEKEFISHIHVSGDVYHVSIDIVEGSDWLRGGSTVVVAANAEHWRWSRADGHTGPDMPDAEYVFEIPEEYSDLIQLDPAGSDPPNGTGVTAAINGDGDGRVIVRLKNGSGEEVASNDLWLHVREDYHDLLPFTIDRDLAPGKQITVQPHFIHYYRDESGNNISETETEVRFRWEYDKNCVEIRDQSGNVVGDTDDGYQYTPDSYGDGRSFTITRLGDWDTDIRLVAEIKNEGDENWHDDFDRHYHLNSKNYDIWFEDLNEGDHGFIFSDSSIRFRVNTEKADEDDLDYELRVHFGFGWDEEGDLVVEIPGDYYTLEGNYITLDGAKMMAVDEIRERGYIEIDAELYVGEMRLAQRGTSVRIESAEEYYEFGVDEYEAMLPSWTRDIPADAWYHVRNAEYPDWKNFELKVLDVTLENENEEEPSFVLNRIIRSDTEEIIAWRVRALEKTGHAELKIIFEDRDGAEKQFICHLDAVNDVYYPRISLNGASEFLNPGQSVTLYGAVNHWYWTEEEGHGGPEMPEAEFEFEIPEEFREFLELTPKPDDPAGAVTVRAPETAWEGDAQVIMRVYGKDRNTGERVEVGQIDFWLHIRNDYIVLMPLWIDNGQGLAQKQEVEPKVIHSYIGNNGRIITKELEGIVYQWEYDENALVIKEDRPGVYTIERLNTYDTEIRLTAKEIAADGSEREIFERWYHLDDLEYYVFFPESSEEDGVPISILPGNNVIHLDTTDLDRDGEFGYEILWQVWHFDEEEDDYVPFDASDFCKISEDGKSVTVNGGKMALSEDAAVSEIFISAIPYYKGERIDHSGWEDEIRLERDGNVFVTGVALDKESIELKNGEEETLTAQIIPEDATCKNVTWESSAPEIVSVGADGTVKALAAGTAVITVTTEDTEKTASCTVTVKNAAPVENMTLDKTELEIPATKSEKLTPVFTPADAGNKNVTWTSSNTKVAVVDENGVVTGKVTGDAVITAVSEEGGFKAECKVKVLFSDVTNKKLANFTAIYTLVDRGVIAGFKGGEFFAPNDQCTRAQVVLFLWRAANKPKPKSTKLTFKDADDIEKLGPQYKQAVMWGNEKGIVMGFTSGVNKGKFMPNDPCTRAQIVLFLYRYAGKPNPGSGSITFKDKAEIQKMAKDYTGAILWAVNKKITGGYGDGTFRPNQTCTRGECATFLYRLVK